MKRSSLASSVIVEGSSQRLVIDENQMGRFPMPVDFDSWKMLCRRKIPSRVHDIRAFPPSLDDDLPVLTLRI